MRVSCRLGLMVLLSILSLSSLSFLGGARVVEVTNVDRFPLTSGEEVECLGIYIPSPGKKFKAEVNAEIRNLTDEKWLRLELNSDMIRSYGGDWLW